MKEVRKRKIRVIHEKSGKKFETAYNKAMDDLAKYSPQVEFNHRQGFCAYLIYEEYEEIPETLIDRCQLAGYVYHCGECPFLDQSQRVNSNQKTFDCEYARYGKSRVDSMACEKYYKLLIAEGEIPASLLK